MRVVVRGTRNGDGPHSDRTSRTWPPFDTESKSENSFEWATIRELSHGGSNRNADAAASVCTLYWRLTLAWFVSTAKSQPSCRNRG